MIERWIEEFHSTNAEIERAIECEDSARLRTLDSEAQAAWQKIISYEPSSLEERRSVANFLLENLIGIEENSSVNRRIKDKLLSLIVK